jgi:hypothetical protein
VIGDHLHVASATTKTGDRCNIDDAAVLVGIIDCCPRPRSNDLQWQRPTQHPRQVYQVGDTRDVEVLVDFEQMSSAVHQITNIGTCSLAGSEPGGPTDTVCRNANARVRQSDVGRRLSQSQRCVSGNQPRHGSAAGRELARRFMMRDYRTARVSTWHQCLNDLVGSVWQWPYRFHRFSKLALTPPPLPTGSMRSRLGHNTTRGKRIDVDR